LGERTNPTLGLLVPEKRGDGLADTGTDKTSGIRKKNIPSAGTRKRGDGINKKKIPRKLVRRYN